MIEIVMLVCLAASPGPCDQKERISFQGTSQACVLLGQQVIAAWLDAHPGHRVDRWVCGPPSKDA